MSQTVKVGILASVALAILAFLILRIEDLDLFSDGGEQIAAEFDSVAGLDDQAAVRVAGVRVGRVDGIGLEGTRARVGILLEEPLGLTEGTRARITSLGLLGDKYVELVPGPPGAPPLPEGAVVPGIATPTFDDAMAQLQEVGSSIQELTGSLAGTGTGENLNRMLVALGETATEIRLLVEENRRGIASTISGFDRASNALADELPRLARRMDRLIDEVSGVLEANEGALNESLSELSELAKGMDASIDDLNFITSRVAAGEGTLGKLVASDELHDELISTLGSIEKGVESLSGTLDQVNELELGLGVESFYLADTAETHNSFRLDIDPQGEDGGPLGLGRLYRVALVDDPRGGDRRTTTEVVTTTLPDGTTETRTIETVRRDDDPTLSALFGFRNDRGAVLWAGLIEDSVGVQVDYPLLSRDLWLSVEAFDFDRESDLDPHLRLSGEWRFHRNFYLLGGYDDLLEDGELFVGGGVRWTDDNLKLLLGAVPRF